MIQSMIQRYIGCESKWQVDNRGLAGAQETGGHKWRGVRRGGTRNWQNVGGGSSKRTDNSVPGSRLPDTLPDKLGYVRTNYDVSGKWPYGQVLSGRK